MQPKLSHLDRQPFAARIEFGEHGALRNELAGLEAHGDDFAGTGRVHVG